MRGGEYELVGVTGDLREASKACEYADYIGYRLDRADNHREQLSEYDGELPLIVSNPPERVGGTPAEADRLDELLAAAESEDVDKVEIDLQTVEEADWIVNELRERDTEVIVVYYNFEETPEQTELEKRISECDRHGDIAKILVFGEEREDALVLLEAFNTASQRDIRLAGASLGTLGQHTRVIGVFYGATLCYAPIERDEETDDYGKIDLPRLSALLETTVHDGDTVAFFDRPEDEF